MPSKDRLQRKDRGERYRKQVNSESGFDKFIPNRPLQGELRKNIYPNNIGVQNYGKRVLGRSRTYPGSPGRLSQNKVSGSEDRKSASHNNVNCPRFSKFKFGEKLPFVGCKNCTPWVVCNEHEAG